MTGPIDASPEQWEQFVAASRDGPVHMLNFLKFKERADYGALTDEQRKSLSEDLTTDVPGMEAYLRYGANTQPHLERRGAKVVWSGTPELVFIGSDTDWDALVVVEYPEIDTFQDMVGDPDYRRGLVHREAGLESSRLIRCRPGVFGG